MVDSSAGTKEDTASRPGLTPRLRVFQPGCIREVTLKRDMGWAIVRLSSGSVLAGYHLNEPPSNHSWQSWLEAKKQEIQASNLARVVVFTEGGAPSKAQQSLLKNTIYPEWTSRGIKAKVGIQIITTNQIFGSLIGATTAVLRIGARVFGLERLIEFFGSIEGALDFVGIPPREWEEMKAVRDYLCQELKSR